LGSGYAHVIAPLPNVTTEFSSLISESGVVQFGDNYIEGAGEHVCLDAAAS
jgi:hypothetical protein